MKEISYRNCVYFCDSTQNIMEALKFHFSTFTLLIYVSELHHVLWTARLRDLS